MRSVVICGSRRFKAGIRRFAEILEEAGVVVFEPILFEPSERDNDNSPEVKHLRRCGVTLHHFAQIRKADVCFIFNEGGYIGVSTTLEMGFAAACSIPIYALAGDTTDPPRGILIDEIISTPEELLKKL